MKKALLYGLFAAFALVSCRKDEVIQVPEVSVDTQNSYDDQAIQAYLESHYLDAKGNVKEIPAGDTAKVKLNKLVPAPVILPSGVVYVVRQSAQPAPGEDIGTYDKLHLMSNTLTYVAADTDGKVSFQAPSVFRNTVGGTGVPELDPAYYYVKKEVLDKATVAQAKLRSFYEIEGFQEALKKFKAYNIPDESNYNLQGVIIVPSRAAFGRDAHYNYTGVSYRNRSFIFNFQVYKSEHFSEPR